MGSTSSSAPGGLPPAEGWRVGLVDEVRRFRNPIVVGGGTPFLPLVTEAVRLDLLETRAFEPRVIYGATGAPAMGATAVRFVRTSAAGSAPHALP